MNWQQKIVDTLVGEAVSAVMEDSPERKVVPAATCIITRPTRTWPLVVGHKWPLLQVEPPKCSDGTLHTGLIGWRGWEVNQSCPQVDELHQNYSSENFSTRCVQLATPLAPPIPCGVPPSLWPPKVSSEPQ